MQDNVTSPVDQPLEGIEGSQNGHGHLLEDKVAQEKTIASMRLLWDRREFIFRLTMAALVVSTVIAFLIPKKFESITRLMPPDQSNSSMAMISAALGGRSGSGGSGSGLGGGMGAIAGDLLGMHNTADLFIGILQSRTVEDDLVMKFNLQKLYGDRYLEDARKDLDEGTDISSDRKSGIIKIQVTDKDPKRAAAMAQEYVDELDRLVTQVNTSSAHRERVFLEGRLNQVKQDLEFAEKSFSEFASKNTALDIPAQGKAMIEAAAALEGQLIVAQTELQGMRQIYADGNVRIRGIQARVNELKKQLQQIGGNSDAPAEPANGQVTYPSIRKLPLLGVSYADYYRNTKIQEAIFETLTQEYELAKVEEAKETPSVKVIDPPDVPEKKSSPHRLLIILVGTFLSCLFGAVWILGNASWTGVDQHDPRKVFALEVFKAMAAHLPLRSLNGSSVTAPEQMSGNDLAGRNDVMEKSNGRNGPQE